MGWNKGPPFPLVGSDRLMEVWIMEVAQRLSTGARAGV